MSRAKTTAKPLPTSVLLLSAILTLFFFQLLTDFVEGIYIFGLLGTSIPPEIGMVLLFLAALLLYLFRGRVPEGWIKFLALIAVLTRSVEIMLSTQGQMIVSGIGVAATLMFFPALLSQPRTPPEQKLFSQAAGYGLGLAILSAVFTRAANSGGDLMAYGMFKGGTWLLAVAALFLLTRPGTLSYSATGSAQSTHPSGRKGRVYAYALGLAGVLTSLYFAFVAPNVVARWAGIPWLPVFSLLTLAWTFAGWWWLRRGTISPKLVLIIGMILALLITIAILPHQLKFPNNPDTGYPLSEPQVETWQHIPLYLMLVLSPLLLFAYVGNIEGILRERPRPGNLAGAFGAAGAFLLVMVLAQVFTTVYDYIPVIGPFFRDKYWLVFLVPSLVAFLPFVLSSPQESEKQILSTANRRIWLAAAAGISVAALLSLMLLTARPEPPEGQPPDSLRVFTYNIQQGYNEAGQWNFDGQVNLVRTKSPDILGLQECDTARIAGGNADVVAHFANRLKMYSYYGPPPVTGTFGIALLSRYPIENPRTFYVYSEGEQVAVIQAEITVGDQTYQVFVTHLGNGGPKVQIQQMLELMRGQEDIIAMGDFNFRPYEEQYALTVAEYDDAFSQAAQTHIPADFDTEERIDHVFVSSNIEVGYVEYLTQPESDHPALYVEIER